MQVRKLTENELPLYSALAKSEGSIFNSTEWLSIYGENISIYGIFDNAEKLIGGFYFFIQKKFGITFCKTPPFSPSIGLFYINKSSNTSNKLTFDKKIISAFVDFLDAQNYQLKVLAMPHHCEDMQPFYWKKYKVIPNYTYLINLEETAESISNAMSPERRNDIKKAEKDNIEIRKTENMIVVKELVIKTFERQSSEISESFLNKILFDFATAENSFAFVAYSDNKPISSAFCIHDTKTAYYLLGGYDNSLKHNGAGPLALRQCLHYAKEIGLKEFDFEGSMIPAVEKYFRGFGGKLTPYYFVNKGILPIELALKFIRRPFF